MAELIAKTALFGQAAITKAGLRLSVAPPCTIYSVALFPANAPEAMKAFERAKLPFPKPGQSSRKGETKLLWTGRDQALMFGEALPKGIDTLAAISIQTGAWVGVVIEGEAVADLLARLIALDLRPSVFGIGKVAKTSLNHVPALVLCEGMTQFAIWVPRSMAATAWHELSEAMTRYAARKDV